MSLPINCLASSIIEASNAFEMSSASLISTESLFLDTLMSRNEPAGTLLMANNNIVQITHCLAEFEEAILKKLEISLGK